MLENLNLTPTLVCQALIWATNFFLEVSALLDVRHCPKLQWRSGVVVITSTAQLHSTIPELRFCAGSNPARGMSEICDGKDHLQSSQLETIPQKEFINSSRKTNDANVRKWQKT